MSKVIMYCDGACRGNPGEGGWGVVLQYVQGAGSADERMHEKELMGYAVETTNNQMELTAAIEGLAALKQRCEVAVYTDSKYVIQGVTEWIHGWMKKNWKTASGSPVKNKELWVQLWERTQDHDVSWHWVKGHSGHPGNERADGLANQAIDAQH